MNNKKIGLSLLLLFVVFSLFIDVVNAQTGPAQVGAALKKLFGFIDDPVSGTLPGMYTSAPNFTWGMALLLTFIVYILLIALLTRVHLFSEMMGTVKILALILSFFVVTYGKLGEWLAPLLESLGMTVGIFAWGWFIIGIIAALFATLHFGTRTSMGGATGLFGTASNLRERWDRIRERGVERGLLRQQRGLTRGASSAIRHRNVPRVQQFVQDIDRNMRVQLRYFANVKDQLRRIRPPTTRIGRRTVAQLINEVDAAERVIVAEERRLRSARSWQDMEDAVNEIRNRRRLVQSIANDLRARARP